ncbi:phosphotransferase family protein [Actinoplanes sp. CA-252034]|uniref:phosphotransferase family protein n=1 Tax=Actinoplanes sp. CA-252034 TaxID=3239906 RepID=UPI003D951149
MDSTDARPLRLGENALYYLPVESTVVRIARTMDYWADAVNEVNVARWLAEEKFPAAQAVAIDQPIEVSGHPVTFWRYIEGRDGDRRDIGTLGTVLRRLHALGRPTAFVLPDEDILGRVESRIRMAEIPSNDKDFLLRNLGELRLKLESLCFPLASAPTHGDAHSENIMIRDGVPVLIDFERFAWGQPEWDLAMTATEYETAGWWTEEEYGAFASAYGYDVRSWSEGYAILRRVHELKMTTWLMQNIGESSDIADEFQVRMRTIRDGIKAKWRPF